MNTILQMRGIESEVREMVGFLYCGAAAQKGL